MRIYYPNTTPPGTQSNGKPWPELRLDQLTALYRIKHELLDTGKSGSVLVGAGMGSGKTVVTIEAILHTKPKRVLIVGVRDAFSQWRDALRDQQHLALLGVLGVRRTIARVDSTPEGQAALADLLDGKDGIFYVGLEMLRAKDWETVSETYKHSAADKAMFPGLEDVVTTKRVQKKTYSSMKRVDLIVSDEAHRHSNQSTDSIKTMQSIKAKWKIALSGTFFGNKFENAWALTTWLWDRFTIGNKGPWMAQWCAIVPVMSKDGRTQLTSPRGRPLTKVTGERHPGMFVETLPCYVFIETPIGKVPDPEIVMVDLGREQTRQYSEMETQSLTWLKTETGTKEPLVADLPIVQRIRLRTAALGGMTLIPGKDELTADSITFEPGCQSAVLTDAYHVLHRPSWVGKKALILTHSRPFAKEAARRIGQKYTVALKTGDVSSKKWDEQKRRFMLPVGHPDSIQYLVAVVSAVGTAMDGLQQNCAKVLWLSEDENNTNNMQGANRVWRDGVDLADYEGVKLVPRGTIAEEIVDKNDSHRERTMASVRG